VECDVSVDSETLLVTDFVNLKINPTQSFRGAHKSRMCMCVFIKVSPHTCMRIYIYTVFLKKSSATIKRIICVRSCQRDMCTKYSILEVI
jgi:hypothetical protein